MQDKEHEILQALKDNDIPCEVATFRIGEEIEICRDWEWNRYLSELQFVSIPLPLPTDNFEYGEIFAQNARGHTIPVGNLSRNPTRNYPKGIVCEFETKLLQYQTGEVKECLEYYQQVILFDGELPAGAPEHFGILAKAKGYNAPSLARATPTKTAAPNPAKDKAENSALCGLLFVSVIVFLLIKACF